MKYCTAASGSSFVLGGPHLDTGSLGFRAVTLFSLLCSPWKSPSGGFAFTMVPFLNIPLDLATDTVLNTQRWHLQWAAPLSVFCFISTKRQRPLRAPRTSKGDSAVPACPAEEIRAQVCIQQDFPLIVYSSQGPWSDSNTWRLNLAPFM